MAWSVRTVGLGLAGVALIGGLGYVAFREDAVAVDLVEVARGPMQVTIDADGQTRIEDLYEVASPITGTARRAPVEVGDPVVAGETVVARVEPVSPSLLDARARAQAEASVAEAQAALDVARSELRRTEEEEEFARLQFDRTQTLVDRGVSTLTQMETAAQRLAVADAAVAAARSRLAMSEGALERAEAALVGPEGGAAVANDCCVTLTSPADGVVLSIGTISEHPVQAGAPLVTVGDPRDLEIVADLLSSDAVRIGPGTRAIVERWGGPDALEAVLRRIEPAAETRVSSLGIEEQRVDAIFTIESPPEARPGLGHGFSVFLRIVEWESPDALQVPLGALFRRQADWAVFVVEDGVARERTVTVGRRGQRTAQITGGLEAGDLIVTHPGDSVADGVKIVDRSTL
ncbi:HlyD family efflux transporter periplasmic adaptor subunit [Roseibacterium sp. SDUM158017]|uniref:efflux RND transporter periplasmic adaptor subunit n=1 Tax=Roseicyclus salinarum TaxID=3036773 RepID=UPI0024152571|nr:HlyD family efflux transporter periplasmic adaptor subunit [Roseibacterium sp. SDUM158017]MDG4648009.1 HlyD family efflux transporter periplasmic adaptor subunit [Roseibacterium sp. SDUM158017]